MLDIKFIRENPEVVKENYPFIIMKYKYIETNLIYLDLQQKCRFSNISIL